MLCVMYHLNRPTGFWEEYLKFHQCIFNISLFSPLGNGSGPLFEQTWLPLTQGCFVPSLVEIGPLVLEETIFVISSVSGELKKFVWLAWHCFFGERCNSCTSSLHMYMYIILGLVFPFYFLASPILTQRLQPSTLLRWREETLDINSNRH